MEFPAFGSTDSLVRRALRPYRQWHSVTCHQGLVGGSPGDAKVDIEVVEDNDGKDMAYIPLVRY